MKSGMFTTADRNRNRNFQTQSSAKYTAAFTLVVAAQQDETDDDSHTKRNTPKFYFRARPCLMLFFVMGFSRYCGRAPRFAAPLWCGIVTASLSAQIQARIK
ncbi:hypothetical protein EYF80_023208 [Liparis tanakae]|uniref:Uncharacterized protein n=1 Tax=Liparis tanakae TaxID=230148 RepID=A0A4Z2HP13_9TELE|nr:hypothetical protein EYF80_023208 [Liparis tanakae]